MADLFIAFGNGNDLNCPAATLGSEVLVLDKNFQCAATNGPETGNGDLQRFTHFSTLFLIR